MGRGYYEIGFDSLSERIIQGIWWVVVGGCMRGSEGRCYSWNHYEAAAAPAHLFPTSHLSISTMFRACADSISFKLSPSLVVAQCRNYRLQVSEGFHFW